MKSFILGKRKCFDRYKLFWRERVWLSTEALIYVMLPKALVTTDGLVVCGEWSCGGCHIRGIWGKPKIAGEKSSSQLRAAEFSSPNAAMALIVHLCWIWL